MGFVELLSNRSPARAASNREGASRRPTPMFPKLAFLNRRVRFRTISIPIGVVLFFPLLLLIFFIVFISRLPESSGGRLIPAGSPPSIRYDAVA